MLSLLSNFAIQAQRSIPPQSAARVMSVGALLVGRKLITNQAFYSTVTRRKSVPKFVPEQRFAHVQMHSGGRTNAEKKRQQIKQVKQMYRRKVQNA